MVEITEEQAQKFLDEMTGDYYTKITKDFTKDYTTKIWQYSFVSTTTNQRKALLTHRAEFFTDGTRKDTYKLYLG